MGKSDLTWQHGVIISDVFRFYDIGCFPAWSWFLGGDITRAKKTGLRYCVVLHHIKDIALEFGWKIALLRPSVITSISSNSFCPATISRNISITTVISIMALFATLQRRNFDERQDERAVKKKHTLKQVTSLGSLRWGIWGWPEGPVARPGALSRSAYLAKPGGDGPRSRVEGGGGGS